MNYRYHCRPEYGSDQLLIEFISGAERETFLNDLLDALSSINPNISGLIDVWMNDEFLYTIDSDRGRFTLSRDIWGFAFILREDDPACISVIDKILIEDIRFEKSEINHDKFKIK